MARNRAKLFLLILIVCLLSISAVYLALSKENPLHTLFFPLDNKTGFVIIGLDESGLRADSIISGCLNASKECINLLPIPRDTLITVPADRLAILKEHNSYTPNDGQMKINAIYSYGGEEYGADFTVKQIEDLFGVTIKYYITVDLESFRYIVDQIGGVEFDVPFRMKYTDPVQGLDIDLNPGLQLLSGKQAEGLVRFRKSDNGSHPEYTDISRTQTQQAFIKAIVKKIASDNNLLENVTVLIPAWLKYTHSNIDAATAAKYLGQIQRYKNYDIVPNSLVSKSEYRNGTSYVILDLAASKNAVDSVFGLNGGVFSDSSKGTPIMVLNGGSAAGLAARSRDFLVSQGFTISGIGDYEGERVSYTRIFVKRNGMGKDIQALYLNSKIIVDDSAFNEDIVIVLGLDMK